MRRSPILFTAVLLSAAGCSSRTPSIKTVGAIPAGQRTLDLRDDQIRLEGVDRAPAVPSDQPLYMFPVTAVEAGFNYVFVYPTERIYRYFTQDTPARAARDMIDPYSPDKRRHGILRLADDARYRQNSNDTIEWTEIAARDKDYTVRAAAIRALNWSRDRGHSALFIAALNDEQPLVRMEAAKALANLPDISAITPLIDHLNDISPDVRIACADALRSYRNDESAHALIAVLDDPTFAIAWQARQSLRLMTAHDFQYDERAWLGYLSEAKNPFP